MVCCGCSGGAAGNDAAAAGSEEVNPAPADMLRQAFLAEQGVVAAREMGADEHIVVAECPPTLFAGDLFGAQSEVRAWRRQRRILSPPLAHVDAPRTSSCEVCCAVRCGKKAAGCAVRQERGWL